MKLSSLTIYIIAISIAIIIVSVALFRYVIPNYTETGYQVTYRDQLQAEANKKPQAEKRVANAVKAVQAKADAWNVYVADRTPPKDVNAGGINLAVNSYQLSVDTLKFRNNIQRAVNAQIKKGGVKVISGPYIPGPEGYDQVSGLLTTYYHLTDYSFPVVIFNLGPIVVQGTAKQIEDNVRSYRNMPHYLAMADGLTIEGTSPHLTGTYNVAVVGFIRGNKIFGTVPEAGGASGATGTPAGFSGFGGPGRGVPGLPPGAPISRGGGAGDER